MCCGDKYEEVEPLRIIGWIAYYEDAVFTSRTHAFAEIPDDGLQHLMVYENKLTPDGTNHTRQSLVGYDNYLEIIDSQYGNFYAANNDSTEENARRYPNATIKRGKWVHPAKADQIAKRAFADKWQP